MPKTLLPALTMMTSLRDGRDAEKYIHFTQAITDADMEAPKHETEKMTPYTSQVIPSNGCHAYAVTCVTYVT